MVLKIFGLVIIRFFNSNLA